MENWRLTLSEDGLDAIDEWLFGTRDDEGDLGEGETRSRSVSELTSLSTANLTSAAKSWAPMGTFLIFG